jgi:hypothetical protein
MNTILELFVILDDKPGSISELTRLLKKKRISIFAIGLFIDTARLYVSHPEKALEVIQESDYQAELRKVLRVQLPNKQGALMELTQKLANAEINIKYLYGTMEDNQKRGIIILEVDKTDLAVDIFKNHRF